MWYTCHDPQLLHLASVGVATLSCVLRLAVRILDCRLLGCAIVYLVDYLSFSCCSESRSALSAAQRDVYKRQGMLILVIIFQEEIRRFLITLGSTNRWRFLRKTVSYTHLDVYKRQRYHIDLKKKTDL